MALSRTFIALALALCLSGTAFAADFPAKFRWCVATAAHQIEGGNTASDWWAWEHTPGHIKRGEISGAADDHWNRVDQDISLLKELGVTDYRLSIEWAKIEPHEGMIDEAVVAHYRDEITALERAGIQPIITLQHFTLPEWIAAKGAWEWTGFAQAFSDFTALVYLQIAPNVRDFITINEPGVMLINGYQQGVMPPGEKRDVKGVINVAAAMLTAHASAYHRLHELAEHTSHEVRVGIAHHLRAMEPANKFSLLDWYVTGVADQIWNWMLPDAMETGHLKVHIIGMINVDRVIAGLAHTQEFVGVNYYSRDKIRFSMKTGMRIETSPRSEKSDLGWDIVPRGIGSILDRVAKKYPNRPILITENGIADYADRKRSEFIVDHLREVSKAIARGARVEGYCHWSLMDNFEWNEGFSPRFGLYEVDYATQERKARPSAMLFQKIIETNALPE